MKLDNKSKDHQPIHPKAHMPMLPSHINGPKALHLQTISNLKKTG